MEFHVYENARAACEAAGVLIAAQITRKGDSVLGLATGSTPIPAYEMLVQWYDRGVIDFDRVRTFNLDEYVGIDHKNPLSYHAFMQEHLFSKVNLRKENVHLPSGNAAADVEAFKIVSQILEHHHFLAHVLEIRTRNGLAERIAIEAAVWAKHLAKRHVHVKHVLLAGLRAGEELLVGRMQIKVLLGNAFDQVSEHSFG